MFDEVNNKHYNCIAIEPPHPIAHFLYKCDKIFHVDALINLYQEPDQFGFVYINGSVCHILSMFRQDTINIVM